MSNTAEYAILIIDDDVNNIEILKTDLEDEGYDILTGTDGQIGLDVLRENQDRVVCVLLDRMMPNMDGMEFMKHVKADDALSQKPVIMQTAAAEQSQVAEGIAAGVYYYLTKPYEPEVMLSIVRSAIAEYAELNVLRDDLSRHQNYIHLLTEGTFEIRTLDEARYLSAHLANAFPEPEAAIVGLLELMINAVEHGNLGVSYDEKTRLLQDNIWEEEITKRQQSAEYKGKKATVQFNRLDDSITIRIEDEGQGFDWQDYMELSPERATHSHGCGIAMSNLMSFDALNYHGKGNIVECKEALK